MPEDPERSARTAASRPHCLIAGAGIGGLAAALFLARAGWRVTLAERESELQEVGAGLQLAPNASRLLAELGILADLDDIAVEPVSLVMRRGADGAELCRCRLGTEAAARYGAPFLVVHRADLQQALLRRAEADAHIALETDMLLVEIRESGESITGEFETKSGTTRLIAADMLVGADGLWSRTRQRAGLAAPGLYSGKTAWRTLIPRAEAPIFAREADVNLWFGRDVHLVHYPVCGGREINVVAIIEDDWREEGWAAPGNPDIIASRFRPWCRKARDLMDAATAWNRWALIDRPPESRWSRGRMTLLGDAAHPMLPFLAQGASQAIEDAATLGVLLGGEAHDIPARLRRYDALRIPRTARIRGEARRQARIYHLGGIAARLRDTAIRALPPDMLFRRFDWIFTHDARVIAP